MSDAPEPVVDLVSRASKMLWVWLAVIGGVILLRGTGAIIALILFGVLPGLVVAVVQRLRERRRRSLGAPHRDGTAKLAEDEERQEAEWMARYEEAVRKARERMGEPTS